MAPDSTTELKRAILSCLQPHKRVSFVHFERVLTPEFDVIGDRGMTYRQAKIIIWAGMTNLWIQALCELLTEQRIVFQTTSKLTYYQEGRALDLPLAHSWEETYRSFHWMPVTCSLSLAPG